MRVVIGVMVGRLPSLCGLDQLTVSTFSQGLRRRHVDDASARETG